MYPIISSPKSPTTPQDVQMIRLSSPVQADKLFSSPAEISSMKSTNAIRNNMDFKNELKKQRTSLHFHQNDIGETPSTGSISTSSASSTSTSQQAIKLATVKRCYSRSDTKSRSDQYSSSGSNRSSIVQSPADNNVTNNSTTHLFTIDAKDRIGSNGVNSNGKNQAFNHVNYFENDGDVIYIDLYNGNISHNSHQISDSVNGKESSLIKDYFLCEKFKNTTNAKLSDAVTSDAVFLFDDNMSEKGMSMELLSPHEAPMGRRYAEIAPSKNSANIKW